ncbi:MAG TPA: hypothetical protein VKU93_11065 [Terracidiphilus sp.]|jgi:hypothetical protein|nr:hypothetical protein [Terracidiphilus sp.]
MARFVLLKNPFRLSRGLLFYVPAVLPAVVIVPHAVSAQVITIDTSGKHPASANGPVDRQFQQIQPTHVALSTAPMGARDKLEIVRIMQSEQGFAMRPFPRGHKGLTLTANGKLEPAGEAYLNMVTSDGLSAKPGDRLVITDIKIDRNKIVFDLNGGPDARHRFLRHISVGMGDPTYGTDTPIVADNGEEPTGARLTLAFQDHVPELTGEQVKALLAPLISFDVKTPVQAYTDTLPRPLKEAILNHQVLVGMNTDMVLFARGEPAHKMHEMDGQMPIEIWLYGQPPEDVTFVRINGNRVIRVEVAKVGKPIEVFDKDVVDDMLRADGRAPVSEQAENTHVIREGDVQRDPDKQAPAPPPTLRNPGETLPQDSDKNNAGVMKPVHFPKPQPDDYPDASKRGQQQEGGQQSAGQQKQDASAPGQPVPASSSGGPPAAGPQNPQPATPAPQATTIGGNPDSQ